LCLDLKFQPELFILPEARGSGGRALSVCRFLQFFNENNTVLGILYLNFLLKAIFLISSIIHISYILLYIQLYILSIL